MKTRNIAAYLREVFCHAVEHDIDRVSIDIATIDEIVNMLEKVDSLIYQAKASLNQAIYTPRDLGG